MLEYSNLLLDNVRNHPDRLAVVSRHRMLTYPELNQESNWVANALRKKGIGKGDRLALLGRNSVEWVVIWQACQKLGVVVVPLHSRLTTEEFVYVLTVAQCSALIYGKSFSEAAAEMIANVHTLRLVTCYQEGSSCGADVWQSAFGGLDDSEAKISLSSNDPALILFTSGTTCRAKGVIRTQEMIVLHAITLALENDNTQLPTVMMTLAPLYHSGGLLCLLKMSLLGGTLLVNDRFEPSEILDLIEQYHVTQLMLLPPITYERLYACKDWSQRDLSSVNEVCISAGRCTCEFAFHIFEMFPNCHLRPSWGATETCSVTGAHLTREALEADPGLINCVGSVNAMTEIRIVNEQGQDVPEGMVGEALVRSPMVFSGYLGGTNSPEAIFLDGGWFRTGDLMRMDPKTRYYYFMDRRKDMIKTGGENVYAPEIERVIQEHPAVSDCAVIGVPDPRFDEGIAVAVVLYPGSKLTGEELTEFCKARLPSFKKPRYLAILDKLPVNSVGKVQKNRLRERAEALFHPIF